MKKKNCGAIILLAFLLAGCADSGRGVFQKAENLFRDGRYELSLKYYRLLVDSHPNSEFADRALFQQAIILSSYLKHPKDAIRTFKDLLYKYPQSQFTDDALMAIGAIYRSLEQYPEALRTFEQALRQFPENRDMCADAQLAIGRIRFQLGDPGAIQALNIVIREYPDKTTRCAEAQYLMGQFLQEVQRDSNRAVKAYQAVLEDYPDSQFAQAARQAIGFIYYQRKLIEEAEGKRVFIDSSKLLAQMEEANHPFIQSLQICIAARGARATIAELLGLTGLAFEASYARDQDSYTSGPHTPNPIDPVCSALGLHYESIEARDAQEAWAKLRQTLDEGQPAIALIRASPPRWLAIVGYNQKASQIILQGRGMAVRRISLNDFERTWLLPPSDLMDPPPSAWARFVFFSIRGTPQPAMRKRAQLRSMKIAALLLRGSATKGPTFSGLKAFQELQVDLETLSSDPTSERRAPVMTWASSHLPNIRSARREAVSYLRTLSKEWRGGPSNRLRDAAESLSRSNALLGRLQEVIAMESHGRREESGTGSATDNKEHAMDSSVSGQGTNRSDAQTRPEEQWLQASQIVQEIIEKERAAADAMAAVGES